MIYFVCFHPLWNTVGNRRKKKKVWVFL
jgi:hypothetical protein